MLYLYPLRSLHCYGIKSKQAPYWRKNRNRVFCQNADTVCGEWIWWGKNIEQFFGKKGERNFHSEREPMTTRCLSREPRRINAALKATFSTWHHVSSMTAGLSFIFSLPLNLHYQFHQFNREWKYKMSQDSSMSCALILNGSLTNNVIVFKEILGDTDRTSAGGEVK